MKSTSKVKKGMELGRRIDVVNNGQIDRFSTLHEFQPQIAFERSFQDRNGVGTHIGALHVDVRSEVDLQIVAAREVGAVSEWGTEGVREIVRKLAHGD